MLEVKDLVLRFGGVTAIDHISFTVADDEICGLIGPNGAGKTSLFNCVTRVYAPSEGSIVFDGTNMLALRRHQIVTKGVARTFQNLALFPSLSVADNVMVGAHSRTPPRLLTSAIAWPPALKAKRELEGELWYLLELLELADVANRPAKGLPFGTLKRVELARALMSRPTLLLLDEPAGGLTQAEVHDLGQLIVALRKEFRFSALLVEHHMGLVMGISDHVVAMDFGRKIADGSPAEVQRSPAVVESYLGEGRMTALLEVQDLHAGYGGATVLHGIDLTVDPGEVVVVLGANGAGKTTLMRAITGLIGHTGTISVDGRPVGHARPDVMLGKGIGLVPQGRGTLTAMSVKDNLRVGAINRGSAKEVAEDIDKWCTVFPKLANRTNQIAGTLSGGEQQMLAIARVMMSRPRLLLCDEVSLGLAPIVVQELFGVLRAVNADSGTALLLVEQNAELALDIAARVYLLEVGSVAASGPTAAFRENDAIRRAYLGY